MKIEINFYQVSNIVENGVAKSIAPLLLKILEDGKRALIYSKDTIMINSLDNGLWSFGKNKFIPHVTIFDQEFEQKSFGGPFMNQPRLARAVGGTVGVTPAGRELLVRPGCVSTRATCTSAANASSPTGWRSMLR